MMTDTHPFTDDARSVYHRLVGWVEELDTLTGLYDDWGFVPIEKQQQAHEIYKKVKEGLRAERKDMSTQRGRAELTPAETQWYEWPMRVAADHLRAPIGSRPEKYYDPVMEARGDLTHTISEMRAYYDIPEE